MPIQPHAPALLVDELASDEVCTLDIDKGWSAAVV